MAVGFVGVDLTDVNSYCVLCIGVQVGSSYPPGDGSPAVWAGRQAFHGEAGVLRYYKEETLGKES